MSVKHPAPAIEIVYDAPDGRLNEDAWLLMWAGPLGERVVFAAIDGATTRLTPPPLQQHLDALPVRLTPAAFSARVLRDAMARQVAAGTYNDLRSLILEGNAALRRELTEIFGDLTLEGMDFPDEVYDSLAHDPRLVRLGLPASVVTVAEFDPAEREIRWAHAGDTALLVAYDDGRIEMPASPESVQIDSELKRITQALREVHPAMTIGEIVQRPEIKQRNLHSALYHNYVDEHSLPQPSQGVGVVDGLPELRYFIQTGSVDLNGVSFVAVVSDGLEWPANADEVFADSLEDAAALCEGRRTHMVTQINRLGLQGYLRSLREAEALDSEHEQYPRFKTHDDATGVLLRFD
ncbi:MAG: hypothetical protein GYB65_05435 [Chloroflexi bacterium]|nr:hypothetical protein [Chloroflexota bacterium]